MLNMLGFIDQNFVTGEVTITPVGGRYVRGKWQPSELPQSTTHEATKQSASSEELRALALGGERYTHVAKFYIIDVQCLVHLLGINPINQYCQVRLRSFFVPPAEKTGQVVNRAKAQPAQSFLIQVPLNLPPIRR